MNWTINNALIPLKNGYATLDVQVVDTMIGTILPNLEVIGTEIDGENKLYYLVLSMPIPILRSYLT
ncbi:hypothetical protein [Trichormus azollae]|jgi:hypothetical protein|uniref:Uncharacterized protein n=1 Tax=Nostoc azollae (strain 0708) TaxID=551115 RepID=D7DWW9_NOSA0|nr:hypothetical protein [Trichormus azollae]ADI64142.1 hypothetical protein Aazo_2107 ['Nostoc azollae' 0708]